MLYDILPQPPFHLEIFAKTANYISILLVIMVDTSNLEGIADKYQR